MSKPVQRWTGNRPPIFSSPTRFGHAPRVRVSIDVAPYNPDEPIRRRRALAFGYGSVIRFQRQPRQRSTTRGLDILALALAGLAVFAGAVLIVFYS